MKVKDELKQAYREELQKVWKDKDMVDYCVNKAQRVVRLTDGSLVAIEKQKVQTSFCYGYGWNGVSSETEHSEACDMAQKARSDEDMFIAENMAEFSPFDKEYDHNTLVLRKGYEGRANIKSIGWAARWETNVEPISAADREILLKAYEEEKAVHLKKVQAYLKRYGLSKVRSWAYLVD